MLLVEPPSSFFHYFAVHSPGIENKDKAQCSPPLPPLQVSFGAAPAQPSTNGHHIHPHVHHGRSGLSDKSVLKLQLCSFKL